MPATRPRRPAAELVHRARLIQRMNITQAAQKAGVSYARWRQVEADFETVSAGVTIPANPPPETLARIAGAVAIDPDRLEAAAREHADIADQERVAQAADMLREMLRRDDAEPVPEHFPEIAEPGIAELHPALRSQVWAEVGGARDRTGKPENTLTGADIFTSRRDVATWDGFRAKWDVPTAVWTIAYLRAVDEWLAGTPQGRVAI